MRLVRGNKCKNGLTREAGDLDMLGECEILLDKSHYTTKLRCLNKCRLEV
jgi:hypothetical protein